MNSIIITSGGTSEPIDKVRKISNNSSGRLGATIANFFAINEEEIKIYYVCGKNSILPDNKKNIELIKIETVQELKEQLKYILENNKINLIIKSMEVSK